MSIFFRHGFEPILTPNDLSFEVNAVLNPGVAMCNDEIILLSRIEDREGISHIRVARSRNGVDNWKIADAPLLQPAIRNHPFRNGGAKIHVSRNWTLTGG